MCRGRNKQGENINGRAAAPSSSAAIQQDVGSLSRAANKIEAILNTLFDFCRWSFFFFFTRVQPESHCVGPLVIVEAAGN